MIALYLLWVDPYLRHVWNLYIQDKWEITENLNFTLEIRHDQYSDFAGTTNPRIGLIWNFLDKATLKLLYGRAFRAPSFREFTLNAPPKTLQTKYLLDKKEIWITKISQDIVLQQDHQFRKVLYPIV